MYNLADTFFLGRLGKEAVSAPSIALNIFSFLIVFGFGFASAGTTLIAQSIGKGDKEKADFYLGQMTTLMTATSLAIAAAGILLSPLFIKILLVPDEARLYTLQYMTIIFAGLPFMFRAFILQGSLQGIGDSLTPLLVQEEPSSQHYPRPVLVFGAGPIPSMEVKGAAFASVFSQFTASASPCSSWSKGKGESAVQQNLRPARKRTDSSSPSPPSSIGQGVTALGFTFLRGS
jgi:Na+-driven multidrug efflux pump